MTELVSVLERLRYRFWALPALAIAVALAAGVAFPAIDDSITLPDLVSFSGEAATARAMLQMIATVSVSVAGISFSVIVVALVLASQQLSPRVMQSFQRNRLNQGALATFLATATYALVVLGAVDGDPRAPVPELSVTIAMTLATASLAMFVGFLHHTVRSLNASAVIRRIAAEGHEAIEHPYPRHVGSDPSDVQGAERAVREATSRLAQQEVRAPRAGYIASIEAAEVVEAATACEGFVEQRRTLGEFIVTGGVLAAAWAAPEDVEELASETEAAFVISEERTVDSDVAFPIRQLSDIALKGLSPGINDPTTAENAMDSIADSLVRFAHEDRGLLLRADDSDTPRFRAAAPSFDALVRLGFDQVRRDGARRTSFAIRLLELLAEIRDHGGDVTADAREIRRQAALTRDHAVAVAEVAGDRDLVNDAYARLHGDSREGVTAAGSPRLPADELGSSTT